MTVLNSIFFKEKIDSESNFVHMFRWKYKTGLVRMASGGPYFDDLRSKPEVIDPPQNEDMMDIRETVDDPAQNELKPNVAVSSSVRDLLECPVCLNAMYPPIHQVWL